MGMPKCLNSARVNFQTCGCAIRLKPVGTTNEVRLGYWSHRQKWEDLDDMGGCILPLDQALDHIANNSVFWTWT